jgi:integrase
MTAQKPRARRDRGEGSVYQRSSDGLWMAELRLPNDRRKYLSSKTEEGVKAKLRAAKRELAKAGNLPTSSPTMAQWATTWLKAKKKNLKPGTYVDYERKMLNYVVPAIGRIRLERLTADHVRRVHDYVIETKGLSSTTALTTHRILAKCLTDAAREGRVVQNVATQLDAPRKAVSKRGALTADDARTLLMAASADPVAAVHWSLALLAGLRPGERLGLTREQIDLDRALITVSWQLQRLRWEHGCRGEFELVPGKGKPWPCGKVRAGSCTKRWVDIPPDQEATRVDGGLWLTRPKSRAGWREVPMAPGLMAVVRRHLEQTPPGMHGLVLHRGDEHGRPIDPSDDGAAWHRWLDIAGLEQVEPYTARHTTATLLHALGVPDQTRQAILGHSDATVTAGYTHVAGAETKAAMNQLDDLLKAPAQQIEA